MSDVVRDMSAMYGRTFLSGKVCHPAVSGGVITIGSDLNIVAKPLILIF